MSNQTVRVRFAPSPTGPLHIGGVRTALYNYLFARQHGGKFILRIEDTDQKRFVSGAEEYINESLTWLGLSIDEGVAEGGEFGPYKQSERMDIYASYAKQLVDNGFAYYAFDTPDELNDMRAKLEASNMSAKYDSTSRMSMRNSLTLSEDEVRERLERGDAYVIRIKLPRNEEIRFHDMIRGWIVFNSSQLDDKVLLKEDGLPTYHLANIVDDHLMKISHVIRGEEWLPSAPLHVMLYKYLGWEETMPIFAHLPLILKPDGKGKLSKRDGDRLGFPVFPIEWKAPDGEISSGYRESGYLPEAVVNMLAMLGWHPSDNKELFSLSELIQSFDLDRVSKSGAKFDMDKSKWFNHQFLLQTSPEQIINSIQDQINPIHTSKGVDYLKRAVELLKEKVNFSSELLPLGHYFFEPPVSYDEKIKNKKWNTEISSHINQYIKGIIEFNYHTADQMELYLTTYAEENGINKGMLMQPLRWAVSGQAGGPPIFDMLELIGLEEITNRINIVNTKF
ncbi:MAG: glutamate--tRNA ligase [Woeseiaceae bacterium]|jgi:glutamyl-tRNA synthetase|nr:glutamate--tRNA ligase [Woeseiaceae bacterium]